MPVVIQYQFNNVNQWVNAGEPKLVDTASHITVLGLNQETGKYHVEVLFEDMNEVPNNGLLNAKATSLVPHEFIGYPLAINSGNKPES